MPKRPHIDWTQEELQGLSDAALLGRLGDAKEAEAAADAPGMGRSVKGRRLWRANRGLVENELQIRGLL
jgi:hypothetical protein